MNKRLRQKWIKKIAQENDYLLWANAEVAELRKQFPSVSLKSFAEFKSFLDAAIPKLIHKYLIGSASLRECSGLSPDFAEIAANRGFPVLIESIPGHMRNVVLCLDGPYMVDLTYIQFACAAETRAAYLSGDDDKMDQITHNYLKQVYQDPFRAIKIEKLPPSALPHAGRPHGKYDNLYDPVSSFDKYDIEEAEKYPWNKNLYKQYKD